MALHGLMSHYQTVPALRAGLRDRDRLLVRFCGKYLRRGPDMLDDLAAAPANVLETMLLDLEALLPALLAEVQAEASVLPALVDLLTPGARAAADAVTARGSVPAVINVGQRGVAWGEHRCSYSEAYTVWAAGLCSRLWPVVEKQVCTFACR